MSRSVRCSAVLLLFYATLSGCSCGKDKQTHTLAPILEIHDVLDATDPAKGPLLADDATVAIGAAKLDRATRHSIALANSGDLVLKVEDPTLEKGTDFSIYRALAPCTGNSADPNNIEVVGCRLITVEVKPGSTGDYTDTLIIKSDDPKRSEVHLKLTAVGSRGALQVCISSVATGSDPGVPLDRCSSTTLKDLDMELGAGPVGSTTVRRRVQLTNTGPVDLIIDSIKPAAGDPTDFSVDPTNFHMVLPAQSVGLVSVVFRPSAIGPRTGTITVSADDPVTAPVLLHLTAQGDGAKLCLDPATVDFGDWALGDTSPSQKVTLTSCGTKPLVFLAPTLEGDADFQFVGTAPTAGSLDAGKKLEVELLFKPATLGARTAKLKVSSNDSAGPLQFATLKGNAVPPSVCKLEASAVSIDFGTQIVGTQASRTLTLHNAGNSNCTIASAAIDAAGAAVRFFIASSPPPPFVLGPNGLQAIEIGYGPLDASPPDTGTLTFAANDTTLPGGKLNVVLTGAPVATPECRLTVTPPKSGANRQLNFGVVAIGDKKTLPMIIKNTGNLDCTVQKPNFGNLIPFTQPDPAFTFGTFTPALPSTLKPGDAQSIEVVFSPTSSTGQLPFQTNFISVQTSDGQTTECGSGAGAAGCKEAFLAGTGVVLAIDTVPNSLDFGLVTLGCNSVDKTITIYNVGGAQVTLKGFAIDPVTAPFSIITQPATPLTLKPGDSAQVTVRYRPSTAAVETANLVITHDFSSGTTTVPLKGTGTTIAHQTDTFTQNTKPKTDVIWIIDNSGSMSDKQDFLGQNAHTFINKATATGNDFQVAVIPIEWSGTADTGFPHKADSSSAYPGADINPGEFFGKPQVIRPTDANPGDELEKNFKIGNCCADTAESGLEAGKAALTNPLISDPSKPNSTFVRPDAKLALIVLSDEEDQGASQSVQYYTDLFQQLKGAKNTQLFAFHAIVGDVPDGCQATVGGVTIAAEAGKRYQEAVTRTSGIFRSICSTDWGKIADDIGLDAFAPRLQYFLTRTCDTSTLKVKVSGTLQAIGIDFDYDAPSNSIVFKASSAPPPGATIVADYDTACL